MQHGLRPRLPLMQAQTIDPEPSFDDREEICLSPAGYRPESGIDTGAVMSSVFIREIEDDDLFESCTR